MCFKNEFLTNWLINDWDYFTSWWKLDFQSSQDFKLMVNKMKFLHNCEFELFFFVLFCFSKGLTFTRAISVIEVRRHFQYDATAGLFLLLDVMHCKFPVKLWHNFSVLYREKKQKIHDIKNNIKEAIEVSLFLVTALFESIWSNVLISKCCLISYEINLLLNKVL